MDNMSYVCLLLNCILQSLLQNVVNRTEDKFVVLDPIK